ncbi:MAG: hypothetical protein EU539_06025 [Promethearchaeota archaeon]|nr:MAG: hypothetical protein EU539_06025 [Candidatus Lokiarchaeota archaeon]
MTEIDSILNKIRKKEKNEAIEKLHDLYTAADDKRTRIKILRLLNEIKDNTHFEKIENYFISDEDPDVRIEAAKLLAFHYSKQKNRAVSPLIWVLENETKQEIKLTALQLLVPLAQKKEYREKIIQSLKKMLFHEDDKLKMEAAQALGFLKEKSAINELSALLKSPNRQVRIRATQALTELKDFIPQSKIIPLLIENLGQNSYDLWKYSFEALKQFKVKEVLITDLIRILENTEQNNDIEKIAYLRQGVIRALGELESKRAIQFIINALKDWHYWVNDEATIALDKIEPNWKKRYRYELKKKNIRI